jgi:hypothetical protein
MTKLWFHAVPLQQEVRAKQGPEHSGPCRETIVSSDC